MEKPPQQEKLLRPPGHSLSIRLDEVQEAVVNHIPIACLFCAVAAACLATAAALFGARAAVSWTMTSVAAFAVFAAAGAWATRRALRLLSELRNIKLGLRGEQAVAETLHEVADSGFHIFHDLPGGENWNIDHVAIGTRGVFLVETKARRRRPSRNGQPEHVVTYDGKALQFPSGTDMKAIPQAERNARWLAEFLSRKTAEPVTVESLVVVPGWYVDTKGNFPVKVMNASYLAGFLRGQREKIQPDQMRRIRAALDDKCRDVEF
jgi:hypothetical protein